jgi:hypothetical protein
MGCGSCRDGRWPAVLAVAAVDGIGRHLRWAAAPRTFRTPVSWAHGRTHPFGTNRPPGPLPPGPVPPASKSIRLLTQEDGPLKVLAAPAAGSRQSKTLASDTSPSCVDPGACQGRPAGS